MRLLSLAKSTRLSLSLCEMVHNPKPHILLAIFYAACLNRNLFDIYGEITLKIKRIKNVYRWKPSIIWKIVYYRLLKCVSSITLAFLFGIIKFEIKKLLGKDQFLFLGHPLCCFNEFFTKLKFWSLGWIRSFSLFKKI